MSDAVLYPPIDLTSFDLIVVGTGLSESILAAAAAGIGKTVIHVDPNSFYGSHFASLPLHDLTYFLNSQSTPPPPPAASPSVDEIDYVAIDLSSWSFYSDVEVSSYAPEILEEHSRKFNIDLAGPRVLFCADKCIDLVLKSGANQYLEFKCIDATYVCDKNGILASVPDSRAAIFKDKSLSLTEKNQLMRFFKLVQQHLNPSEDVENSKISDEDLDSPFVDFLKKMRLPPKIKSIVLYAISMADYDQDDTEACKATILTREGIDRLALYHSSVGRFPNAPGALIYPLYGQGELPQAFCRRAAVKGCLYVLRMPVIALLTDKSNENYKGVRLASGQDIFSHQLVLDPSFTVSLPSASSPLNSFKENLVGLNSREVKGKVARGICITRHSLIPDVMNCLVVYPPRTLFPEQVTSVRVLQLGGNLAVCPSGMFVFYFSAQCDDDNRGKELLHAAINAVTSLFARGNPDNSSVNESDNAKDVEPILLWKSLYIQELSEGKFGSITSTPVPDGNLNYNEVLDATSELFQKMYPHEEFFPETASPENPDSNDDGFDPDS